jgi:hypothetical protein
MAATHQHQCPKCLQWWYHAGRGDSDFDIPGSAARCDSCTWPDPEPEPDALNLPTQEGP